MSEFLTIDHVLEKDLPSHATDGRSGDRVAFLEAGLLHVDDGRATFVRWGEVLGVIEHLGAAFVLVPRRPPRSPWIRVGAELVGDEPKSIARFAARLRERGSGGGYRDAVRQRRLDLDKAELTEKVRKREDVPGALEVPSTIRLGSTGHKLEGLAMASLIAGGAVVAYGVGLAAMFATAGASGGGGLVELIMLFLGFAPYVGGILGAFAAIKIRKRWREARDADQPRQRVLVLAPDGCIIGFRTGVKTLKWSEVGSFEVGPTEPEYNDGLVVRDVDGDKLGDLDRGWIDAPLNLVVKVAETYREAAA